MKGWHLRSILRMRGQIHSSSTSRSTYSIQLRNLSKMIDSRYWNLFLLKQFNNWWMCVSRFCYEHYTKRFVNVKTFFKLLVKYSCNRLLIFLPITIIFRGFLTCQPFRISISILRKIETRKGSSSPLYFFPILWKKFLITSLHEWIFRTINCTIIPEIIIRLAIEVQT